MSFKRLALEADASKVDLAVTNLSLGDGVEGRAIKRKVKRFHRHLVGIDLRRHHKIRDCDVAEVEAVDLPVECELPDRERDGIGLCPRTGRRRRGAGGRWLRRLVG